MKIHYLTHFKKNQKNEFLDINFTPFEKNYEECGFKNNDEKNTIDTIELKNIDDSLNYNNNSTSEWDEMIKGINQESFIVDNIDINDKDNKEVYNYDFFSSLSSINSSFDT